MKRNEVALEEKWDLTLLYKSEEDYQKAIESTDVSISNFISSYAGKIETSKELKKALDDYSLILESLRKLNDYVSFAYSSDVTDIKAGERMGKLFNSIANWEGALAFFESTIRELPEEILSELDDTPYRHYLKKIIDKKPYALGKESESLLSTLMNVLNLPYSIYDTAKLRDTVFPDFEVNGKIYSLDYNIFENHMEYEKDTDLRRKAFEVFSEGIGRLRHTIAETYFGELKKQKAISDFRGYKNVFDYLLFEQEIPREVYENQIDTIMEDLPGHMRRYTRILKKVRGLDEVHYSDLRADIDPSYSKRISFDEAKEIILEGVAPFGEEYVEECRKMFEERRIDYAENEGKETGAYCASVYGSGSFIFTSFNHQISETMTLAHELGHSVQGNLAMRNQNILSCEPSLYIIEAPSTAGELMVGKSLIDKAKDDLRFKRWVLSQQLSKTYYHNFVTHYLEAVYQREVYRLIDSGETVDADTLDSLYKQALEKFWGDSIVYDKGCERTWMRQPHYYMGLYSYTYSAGLTIGTILALEIAKNPSFAKKWIEVLKCGGSKSPIELAKMVGIDIKKTDALKKAIAHIGEIVEEIEKISIELGEM